MMTRSFQFVLSALAVLALVCGASAADKKKKAPTAQGTVKSVDAQAGTITLEAKKTKKVDTPEQTISVNKDAKVNVDGKEAKLEEVKAGVVAKLTLTEDKKAATEVAVTGGTIAGAVKAVDAQAGKITLAGKKKKKVEGPDQVITVPKEAKVRIDGEDKTLADVKEGVTATVAVTTDKKTALSVTVGGKKKKNK